MRKNVLDKMKMNKIKGEPQKYKFAPTKWVIFKVIMQNRVQYMKTDKVVE